jgi:hypothetical protein
MHGRARSPRRCHCSRTFYRQRGTRWAALALVAIGAFQIVTDVVFSTKSSDWKKVRRELRAARAQEANR